MYYIIEIFNYLAFIVYFIQMILAIIMMRGNQI